MSFAVMRQLFTPLSSTLQRMQQSVGVAPPTQAMLDEEDHDSCPLLRHLPMLKQKIAYRALGDRFPTPIHEASVQSAAGFRCHFYVKREDLSSGLYGGNKVRTLQFQLAVLEARLSCGEPHVLPLTVIGTYGSNQNVATVVHAASRIPALLPSINVAMTEPEVPDLDSALNVLSILSFTRAKPLFNLLPTLPPVLRATFLGKGTVIMLGGNTPSGCMGQVSALLELAMQIEAGEAPDPDRIYLAIGSSCTVSGLIIGVALSRHLGLKAFASGEFKICGVIIHHLLAGLQRNFDFHRKWQDTPLSIAQTIRATCGTMASLGAPDLTEKALKVLADEVEINDDKGLCGKYGGHSELSRKAAGLYDTSGKTYSMESGVEVPQKPIWLCGHFVAKPFASMIDAIEASSLRGEQLKCILWQTKSAVQPRGNADEWEKATRMPHALKTWMTEGKAESSLRPGSIDPFSGTAADYRSGMTAVNLD
ncbi:hypothetical protein AB1Y20_023243 [Prymnesium parvum]|uniref:Tryptophan synthase beta chain-like PALP domain-containing protein n=1 Tax=Prymnesium parvum TaxID=97485 RepID=A0AB34JCL9_PRYPA